MPLWFHVIKFRFKAKWAIIPKKKRKKIRPLAHKRLWNCVTCVTYVWKKGNLRFMSRLRFLIPFNFFSFQHIVSCWWFHVHDNSVFYSVFWNGFPDKCIWDKIQADWLRWRCNSRTIHAWCIIIPFFHPRRFTIIRCSRADSGTFDSWVALKMCERMKNVVNFVWRQHSWYGFMVHRMCDQE